MPFNELKRRDSWPPTILHLSPNQNTTDTGTSPKPTDPDADLSTIDDNPISFFLTSPEEDDDLYFQEYYGGGDGDAGFEDLSAGIEGSPESKALEVVREVSPSSLQRTSLVPTHENEEEYGEIPDDEVDFEFGVAVPLSLKDFTLQHMSIQSHRNSYSSNGRFSTASEHSFDGNYDHDLTGLGIAIPMPIPIPTRTTSSPSPSPPHKNSPLNNRGRPKVRLVPNNGRGRGKTRSLSAGRKTSWRVPSPDIWSIEEQEENDTGGDAGMARLIMGSGVAGEVESGMGLSLSAPPTGSILQRPIAPALVRDGQVRKKVKKRVHWAS